MSGPARIAPPTDLRGWELEVDGHVFVLFEWEATAPAEPAQLTLAERDVLRGILRGESNATIAERRGTKTGTVANQVAALFRRLGVRSRAELLGRVMRE